MEVSHDSQQTQVDINTPYSLGVVSKSVGFPKSSHSVSKCRQKLLDAGFSESKIDELVEYITTLSRLIIKEEITKL